MYNGICEKETSNQNNLGAIPTRKHHHRRQIKRCQISIPLQYLHNYIVSHSQTTFSPLFFHLPSNESRESGLAKRDYCPSLFYSVVSVDIANVNDFLQYGSFCGAITM